VNQNGMGENTLLARAIFQPALLHHPQESKFLVIVLHGKGDSAKPFLNFQSEVELRATPFLLLNAPRRFLNGYSWYGDPPYQREGVARSRQLLEDMLQFLKKQGWSTEQIFLVGFSQGALMSAELALHSPTRFAGVVGVSGYFNFVPRWRSKVSKAGKQTPWAMIHGTRDDVLPIENTRLGVRKLQNLGLNLDWYEYPKKHTFEAEDEIIVNQWLKAKMQDQATKIKYLRDVNQ